MKNITLIGHVELSFCDRNAEEVTASLLATRSDFLINKSVLSQCVPLHFAVRCKGCRPVREHDSARWQNTRRNFRKPTIVMAEVFRTF